MLIAQLSTIIALGFTSVLALPPSNYTPGVFYGPDGEELPIHYTNDVPATLQKRANTPVNCDPAIAGQQYRLTESHCDRQTSPQHWACTGVLVQGVYNVQRHETRGACGENQICVDGLDGGTLTYCADNEGFIQITQAIMAKMQQQGLQYVYGGPVGDGNAVEAVFTDGDDPTKPVTLDSLDITAVASQLVLGKFTKSQVGQHDCTHCSSLGFEPIPEHSTVFQFKGTFPSSVKSARMYFWESSAS